MAVYRRKYKGCHGSEPRINLQVECDCRTRMETDWRWSIRPNLSRHTIRTLPHKPYAIHSYYIIIKQDPRFTFWSHPIGIYNNIYYKPVTNPLIPPQIDIHATHTLHGWPKFQIQVFHQDSYGRNELCTPFPPPYSPSSVSRYHPQDGYGL
jgi:hypothetical protein